MNSQNKIIVITLFHSDIIWKQKNGEQMQNLYLDNS